MKDIENKKENRPASGGLKAKWDAIEPAKRDKLLTRGITAAVVLVIAGYLLFTMLPGKPAVGPGTSADDVPGIGNEDGTQAPIPGLNVESDQDPVKYQPETVQPDGQQMPVTEKDADGFYYTGGTVMTAVSLSGERVFAFNIPLGFMTKNANNGTWIKPENMDLSVQSSDPFRFAWTRPAGLDSLLEYGWYDFLTHDANDGEVLQRTIEAIGYYVAEKADGTPMPVTLALKTVRFDPSYETAGEDFDEYYIIADCGDGSYFVGSVDGRCLELMYSQRYPDLMSIAKAMIPAVSEPGFPDCWTVPGTQPESQYVQEPDAGDDAQEPGTDPDDGADTEPDAESE